MREAYADLNGVSLWYLDAGGMGEAVVFLHAATGHAGLIDSQNANRCWLHCPSSRSSPDTDALLGQIQDLEQLLLARIPANS